MPCWRIDTEKNKKEWKLKSLKSYVVKNKIKNIKEQINKLDNKLIDEYDK